MNLEKEYYQRWLNAEKENKNLKLELEKYKKIYERNGDFQKQFLRYKNYFVPLENAYTRLYEYSLKLQNIFEDLISLYKSKLLLNPIFSDIKIRDNEMVELINETRVFLRKFQNITLPERYISQGSPEQSLNVKKGKPQIIPTKKEFELKKFVVKKNKKD